LCFYWKSYNRQKVIANAMAIRINKFMSFALVVATCLACASLGGVDAIQLRRESQGYTRAVPHLTDLEYSESGQLVFTELKMET